MKDNVTMENEKSPVQLMQIFRAADAPNFSETDHQTIEPFSPVQREGMDKVIAAGVSEGHELRCLVDLPGFSLTYAWFKQGYPLPLHSHNADCLYYIVSGSLRLGTEELGPRDSFFIPADVPYTYKVGQEGVEVLEFRQQGRFNFVNHSKGAAFWDKAVQSVLDNRENWQTASRPAPNA